MSTPSLPEQAILRADRTILRTSEQADQPPEELLVEETIIDVPDDVDDPERAAVAHPPEETISERLDVASEFDLREQTIDVPQDDDEPLSR